MLWSSFPRSSIVTSSYDTSNHTINYSNTSSLNALNSTPNTKNEDIINNNISTTKVSPSSDSEKSERDNIATRTSPIKFPLEL